MTPPRSPAPVDRRIAAPTSPPKSKAKSDKAHRAGKAAKRNGDGLPVDGAAADRNSDAAEQTMLLVGARIRGMRLRQQLTLRDVAERTGVSVSMLSMLERGVSTASVSTLVAVASALGVQMYELFAHKDGADESPVTRLAEQTVVPMGEGTTRRIAHLDVTTGLELAVNEYELGGAGGPSATGRDGRRFGVLISGELTVELDGQSHVLQPGDVIAYSSERPHRIANTGNERAVAVWVYLDQT